MPNLPKPRLRRASRRAELTPQAPAPERRKPNVETIAGEGLRWVKIEHPSSLEWGWLEEHFDFHGLDLEDVLSRNERPKIDEYPDYLFIVLHFPVFDPTVRRLNAGELDMFVGPDFLITIPNQPLQPVEYLFERCRAKEELREQIFSRGSGYLLYRIVDDIVDAHERIWDLLENYKEVVEALEDTNESLISHRVNDILRVLTAISVIVLPLTMIASIFGMNVGLPGGGDPVDGFSASFLVIIGVMAAILVGMVTYFRRRGWL